MKGKEGGVSRGSISADWKVAENNICVIRAGWGGRDRERGTQRWEKGRKEEGERGREKGDKREEEREEEERRRKRGRRREKMGREKGEQDTPVPPSYFS